MTNTSSVEVVARWDVWCTHCRWRRPSYVSRDHDERDAFKAWADDMHPRVTDHVIGMGHDVQLRQRTFWDTYTEATIYLLYRRDDGQLVRAAEDLVTDHVPAHDRELRR